MAFMAAALPMLSTIGTVVGAAGQLAGGAYAAQVSTNNAKVAANNAEYATQAGEVEATDQGFKNAQREGKVRTAIAANGINIDSGSAVDVQSGQKAADTMDVERILSNAGLTAYGYKTQETNYKAQAGMDMLEGITGAASTLLEKAPSLNWKWNSGKPGTGGLMGGNAKRISEFA